MKKIRKKQIGSYGKQIEIHEEKIENEEGLKDTTKEYWGKEIEDKFLKEKQEAEEYLNKLKKKD